MYQWNKTSETSPEDGVRIMVYSPVYKDKDDNAMLYRIMTSDFLTLCSEATHWAYLVPPKE